MCDGDDDSEDGDGDGDGGVSAANTSARSALS